MGDLRRRFERQLHSWLVRYRHAVERGSPTLLDALVHVFLKDLIDDRARFIAAQPHVDKPPEALREEVGNTYSAALARHIAQLGNAADLVALPRDTADALARPETMRIELARLDAGLRSADDFATLLHRIRRPTAPATEGWRAGPLAAAAPARVAQVWLLAALEAALEMVLRDHHERAVPESTRQYLLALFERVQQMAAHLQPQPPLGAAARWHARLHVALARNEGHVHLPLRSIATAPLTYDGIDPGYHGRPDDEPQRLARQMRHADGVVLVTGYRGVGKSSFVNRALHHATKDQSSAGDGWLVVPVGLSVAKATNVASVLRLTLRSVREALIDPDTLKARPVPGLSGNPGTPGLPSAPGTRGMPGQALPLTAEELRQLQWAYERATWNVALSRASVDEGEWSAGVALNLNPGKYFGGGIAPSARLGAKRSQQQKLKRELSLRDYDEDAAEADITRLIDSLAQPRELLPGVQRRIKLVLVFDELDKLDFTASVEPLLDGLKNLFLHRYAVFVLVTSKQMYYKLHDQRSKEDATLSSYFSAVVHVPLLTSAQTRELLLQWIDRELLPEADRTVDKDGLNKDELLTLDRLARYLTYKSLGNPRDIIRELRQMQQWSTHGDQPFLSDRIANLGEVALIAAVQAAVENAAVPWRGAAAKAESALLQAQAGEVTLASERVGADEARLEQIRRGLYILVETAIDRQTLVFDDKTLEPIRENNLSLLSLPDVLRLARDLGNHLTLVTAPVAPGDTGDAPRRPLFVFDSVKDKGKVLASRLGVSKEFYERSGRRAAQEAAAEPDPARPSGNLVADARSFFKHGGDAECWLAIKVVGELPPAEVPEDLVARLREVVHNHTQASYRAAALASTPAAAVLGEAFGMAARVTQEGDDSVLMELIIKTGASTTDDQSEAASEILLRLLRCSGGKAEPIAGLPAAVRPDLGTLAVALQYLAMVAQRDLADELKAFLLANAAQPAPLLEEAVKALVEITQRHDVDLVDELLLDSQVHKASALHEPIAAEMPRMLRRGPMPAVIALLSAHDEYDVSTLLRSVLVEAAGRRDADTARLLLGKLADGSDPVAAPSPTQARLRAALVGPALASKIRPYLEDAWSRVAARSPEEAPRVERARAWLESAREAEAKLAEQLAEKLSARKRASLGGLSGLAYGALSRQSALDASLLDPSVPGRFVGAGLGHTPFASTYVPPQRSVSYKFDAWGALLLLLSPLPFVATFFVPGDVPAGAGFGTLLLGRTISLGIPVCALLLPLLLVSAQTQRDFAELRSSVRRSSNSTEPWQQYAMLPLLLGAYGLVEAHKEYVAPLTFWPTQLGLFLLNSAALAIGGWAVSRMRDEHRSGGYVV